MRFLFVVVGCVLFYLCFFWGVGGGEGGCFSVSSLFNYMCDCERVDMVEAAKYVYACQYSTMDVISMQK